MGSKGEQTRKEIVGRALVLSTQLGLEALSLGTLAEDLKLSKSGLFAHFKSKETLQLAVLQEAIDRFTQRVVLPALSRARGEPRVKAMVENYFDWVRGDGSTSTGGCFFIALATEFDDRPGAVRDLLIASQKEWRATLAKAARLAVDEGHFRADLDVEQFAFDVLAIAFAYQMMNKLLSDPKALQRARTGFDTVLTGARKKGRVA